MTNNPNELTIENSALVLIDHQPAVGLAVHSIDQSTSHSRCRTGTRLPVYPCSSGGSVISVLTVPRTNNVSAVAR